MEKMIKNIASVEICILVAEKSLHKQQKIRLEIVGQTINHRILTTNSEKKLFKKQLKRIKPNSEPFIYNSMGLL